MLGLDRNASGDDVKSAFRRLAQKYHPDRNPGDDSAQQRFKEINAAYQVLSDPDKRARFDRFGESAFQAGGGGAGGSGSGFDVVDFSNLDLDGLFGDLLRGFGVRSAQPRTDLREDVTLTFEEAAFGCDKTVAYDRLDPCSSCGGSGAAHDHPPELCATCRGRGRIRVQQGFLPVALERTCPRCHGKGRIVAYPCSECRGAGLVTVQKSITVSIPPGIEEGATQSIRGAGHASLSDGARGDSGAHHQH